MNENWHPQQFIDSLRSELGDKLEISAEIIKKNAKLEAPVKTGKLKNDIDFSVDRDTLEATIGNSDKVPYALFVELGTKKSPPRAYLRRGLAGSIEEIQLVFLYE